MTGTHLTGLEGTNPLGFFAALGVQVAFDGEESMPRLWWTDDVVSHAVVDESLTIEDIANKAMSVFPAWLESPAITTGLDPVGDVKFRPEDIKYYLDCCRRVGRVANLAACLVAEGSLDNNGVAKPTDLHFTAGQMKFLKIVKEVLEGVTIEDLKNGLTGPWVYESKLGSLMWDVVDDRNYALLSSDPSKSKKLTNPGPEALAILGLSRYPVFGSIGRTLTQGACGTWKSGLFTWPIWTIPGSFKAVDSLLAHIASGQVDLFHAWGIERVMQSVIRRSSQGGNGTIGPPEVIWSRE